MAMRNITAELTGIPNAARAEFAASFGSSFTDHTGGVTMTAGAIDDAWVPICRYALLGVVGEAGVVSYSAEDM